MPTMRRPGARRFAASALLLAALTLGACGEAPKDEPAPGLVDTPLLVCDEPWVDMGRVDWSEKRIVTFTLRNPTDRESRIERIETSCGCASVDGGPRSVAPGATTEVKIEVDFRKVPIGPLRKSAMAFVAGNLKPVGLYFKADVAGPYRLEPAVLDLGVIEPGQRASGRMRIIATRDEPMNVAGLRTLRSSAASMSARILEKDDRGALVEIEVLPTNTSGQLSLHVDAGTQPTKPYGTIHMPVRAWAVGSVDVTPRAVPVPPGDRPTLSADLEIRAVDGEPMVVKGFSAGHPGLDAEIVEREEARTVIRISGQIARAEFAAATVFIQTDRGDAHVVSVPYDLGAE